MIAVDIMGRMIGTRSQGARKALALLAIAVLGAAPPAPDAHVADAVMRSDARALDSLLEAGADVNAPQGDGMTGLHWAAMGGDTQLGEMLLRAGAFVDPLTRNGSYTPLHLASRSGSSTMVALLLETGADPMLRTSTGVTALHLAAGSGVGDAVQRLIDYGAEVDVREWAAGQTPLIFAAASNGAAAIHALLEAGADPALATSVIDVVSRVEEDIAIRQGRDQGGGGAGSPLPFARQMGKTGGMAPLHHAARDGHTESALALLAGGADIDQVTGDHSTPMLVATINGHFDLALRLLAEGADPNIASDAGATPLYATINLQWSPRSWYPQPTAQRQQSASYLHIMEALLNAGADPNARLKRELWYTEFDGGGRFRVSRVGATPFWRAAYGADVAAMKLLVRYGADPGIPTTKKADEEYGGDPHGDLPIPDDLPPPVPVGGPGVWPIHAASGAGFGLGHVGSIHRHVQEGWLPAVRYLVEELGADVNQRDHHGFTPLHNAAAMGDNELVRYLVERGADPLVVSRYGQTVVDMANGPYWNIPPFPETIALLESMGAKNNHHCYGC